MGTREQTSEAVLSQSSLGIRHRAARSWDESEIVITGGTSGIGRETAKQLLRETAVRRVYLVGRNQRNFDRTIREFSQDISDFDPSRINFWQADVSQPETVEKAWVTAVRQGAEITDLIHTAAGGLEPVFTLDTVRRMRRIAVEENPESRRMDMHDLSIELRVAALANQDYAWDVNFHGPKKLLDFAVSELPEQGMIGNMSSIWATTLIGVPGFYRVAVAEPKHAFEDEMEARAGEINRAGVFMFKNTAQLVPDTAAGRGLVDNFVPLMENEERAKLMSFAVSKLHVARANLMALTADPRGWMEQPKTLWVYSEPRIVPPGAESILTPRIRESLDLNHPMFKVRTGFE